MSTAYPEIQCAEGAVEVIFSDPSRRERELPISIVVDRIGRVGLSALRLINLTPTGRKESASPRQTNIQQVLSHPMRYSYDGETDSFYLRLHVGDSSNQRSIVGTLFLDNDDKLLGSKCQGEGGQAGGQAETFVIAVWFG